MAEAIPAALWPRVSAAFDAALALPGGERDAWVAQLPREIASPLRALLQAHDSEARLPPLETATALASAGQHIGPYRLIERIGEGGMAEVWGAEQVGGPMAGRRVALKLPRPGQRLSERLADERALLIGLEHPHIARLYDAGAEGGQPWLALEWVAGEPINQALAGRPQRARLIAFLQVLDAVRHAHARLVLHADIKPGNILVDADGRVKLLDFGIARLLHTAGPRAFTPGLAAPEQQRGEPLTVAA
ncbi:MAG: serine/threonine-protein kinase, partial [Roseateles sp.]